MANSLTATPVTIDTAASIWTRAASGRKTIQKLLWVPAADADYITLNRDGTSASGTYFTLTAVVAGLPFYMEGPIPLDDGLVIPACGGAGTLGTLYLWL